MEAKVTAPTDAPVEERHRRAAVATLDDPTCPLCDSWAEIGVMLKPDSLCPSPRVVKQAQLAANAERDGRAPRDAEVEMLKRELASISEEFGLPGTIRPAEGEIRRLLGELKELLAYRSAWRRWLELSAPFARNAGERILAEELARKGTP